MNKPAYLLLALPAGSAAVIFGTFASIDSEIPGHERERNQDLAKAGALALLSAWAFWRAFR